MVMPDYRVLGDLLSIVPSRADDPLSARYQDSEEHKRVDTNSE
jgi:hypothetical protein